MKKVIINILMACTCILFFDACYEDKSTLGSDFPEAKITVSNFGAANALVEVQQGVNVTANTTVDTRFIQGNDLSYEWRLALTTSGTDTEYEVISSDKNLNTAIYRQPNTNPYYLWFVITDNATGVEYSSYWRLLVRSSAGDGLIIADTKDDQTSDISFVRAACFSSGYTDAIFYKRDGYSAMNGSGMEGIVQNILYSKAYSSSSLVFEIYVMTNKTLERISPETYAVTKTYEDLFVASPPAPKPMSLCLRPNDLMYVNGTDIYTIYTNSSIYGEKFTIPLNYQAPGVSVPKNTPNKYAYSMTGEYPGYAFYDENQDKFTIYIGQSPMAAYWAVYTGIDGGGNNLILPGMEAVGSGPSIDGTYLYVLKNGAGDMGFYRVTYVYDSNTWTTSLPVTTYSTDICPDIRNAFTFQPCEKRNVVYYATSNTVYAAAISGANVSGKAVFTPPSGETVTCIEVFREAWYLIDTKNTTETPMAENANQLIVATYNNSTKEGKVYALKMTDLSGTLEAPSAERTFGGFAKITAMGTQGK